MATISQLPFCLSVPSLYHRKPFFRYYRQPQFFVSYLNSTKKHNFVCFACSVKQSRVRKRVKSNEELRTEIMEFIALAELPQGHVPSMKELSANGRVDLANIVRRRGYKFIRELLANSDMGDCNKIVSETNTNMEASATGICFEDSLTEGQGEEAVDVVDANLSTEQLPSTGVYFNAANGSLPLDHTIENSIPEVVTHGSVNEDNESSLYGVSSIEENSLSYHSGEITENDLKIESVELENRANIENSSSEASISANYSLLLDDSLSCSDREDANCLVIKDEEVNDVNEASISANHSLVLDDTASCSDTEAENVLLTDEEVNDVDEASVSANHTLVLDDTASCSDREDVNVLVTENEDVSDVDEASISANHSLVLDDTSSCSAENVLVTEVEEVYDGDEASIPANNSLASDGTSSCSDREDANILVIEGEEFNDVDEASISANHSLTLDDTSTCSNREDANVLVIKDEEVNDVDEASISVNHSLVLDDTSSCSEREANSVLMTEDEEVNDVDEASISANHSLVLDDASSCSDIEAEYVLMTEDDEEINNVDGDFSYNYDHYTSPDFNYTNHVYIASEPSSALNSENTSSTSSIEARTTRFIQNGYLDAVDADENELPSESYGGQKSVSTPLNGSALALEEVTHATDVNSSNSNSERDGNADLDKDPHDETMKRENQVEISRLRFMLRQKELELSKLKEQIEKEKLSLSVLQREAETEINKAQMLISEKDAELQEAEENLTGLHEVEIEYCGDGNVVEVTGSFNGWQHRVGMELQASKSTGKQKCWSTLLWLYPGTYEIKFIVDGHWTTNPQIDSVTRGHITNNILKIDR